MEKQMEHHKKVKKLEEASAMLCDELGEWWGKLADLNRRCGDCGSDEFQAAYKAEVSREHERLKYEFRLVEAEMPPRRPYKKLVHVDDICDDDAHENRD